MKIKALVSFSGVFSMYKGEVKEYDNEHVLNDLLLAGYIEEVKDKTNKAIKKADKK
ncbi:hypothetical protein [Tissierella creatinophila]|uniref:Uncharacterized protein n=1 Tax=Tissierella creatinophila DSM 6911 TaxID=1123403 RepID=A0A1U7M587_TISCR|nr:hypothetical protein [Tissierella creatinophila]OLS02420.1 hypothetical protein TICRE_16090 [Tissierella creatinophila DSM 6911]